MSAAIPPRTEMHIHGCITCEHYVTLPPTLHSEQRRHILKNSCRITCGTSFTGITTTRNQSNSQTRMHFRNCRQEMLLICEKMENGCLWNSIVTGESTQVSTEVQQATFNKRWWTMQHTEQHASTISAVPQYPGICEIQIPVSQHVKTV